jgi:hypothetical protein
LKALRSVIPSNNEHHSITFFNPFRIAAGIDFILRALVQEKRCIRTSPVIAEIAGQATEKETDTSAPIFQYADTPRVPSSSRAIFSLLKNSRCWTLCGITFVFGTQFLESNHTQFNNNDNSGFHSPCLHCQHSHSAVYWIPG